MRADEIAQNIISALNECDGRENRILLLGDICELVDREFCLICLSETGDNEPKYCCCEQ